MEHSILPSAVGGSSSQREQMLETLLSNMPIGFAYLDRELRYVLVNDRLAAINGLSPAEHVGRRLQDLLPSLAAKVTRVVERILTTGLPVVDQEFWGETLSQPGVQRCWNESWYPIRDDLGNIVGFGAAVEDITERKRSDEALRASEERLREALRVSRSFAFEWHPASDLVVRTESCGELLGLSGGEAVQDTGARFFRRVHPGDREGFLNILSALEPAHDRYHTLYRIVRPDGSIEIVEESGRAFFDSDGKITRLIGITTDVTAREQAQQALRENIAHLQKVEETLRHRAEELERVLELVPAAVWVANDPQCTTITGNRRANEFYEAVPGENVSATTIPEARRFFSADGRELLPDELPMQAAVAANQDIRGVELHVEVASGRRTVMLGNAVPLRADNGEVRGCIGVFLDITERKRTETALRQANAQLAEADRRKDEFISVLSHELRNPLAPIRYALPLLQREPLSESGARAVAVIDRQLDHLTRLVDDLLDVSRVTRGLIELHRDHVTLASVVTAAIEAASPAIAAAQHTLRAEVSEEPVWLHADSTRIVQAITNLLNNSAKYTPRRGQISLDARQEGREAVIRVRDSGIGFPADAADTLFEMYRQVRTPDGPNAITERDRSQGGLGIGLALTRKLIEMHGGSIRASSDGAGCGAEFVIRLPVAEENSKRRSAAQGATAIVAPRPLKILIVDDNADLVEMLASAVEAFGHEVWKAFDGRSALSAAVTYRPDVVLLDVGLPGMDGIEVARRLRQQPETADCRLIALTGWGQSEYRRETKAAGFDHHLTKPADLTTLERLLSGVQRRD